MLNKIKLDSLSDTFAVSDLHYNHDRDFVWGRRGFKSVAESNEALINEWNCRVNNSQTVLHLGDTIFGANGSRDFWNLLRRLNFGTLYAMPGNHFSGYKQAYDEVLRAQFGVDSRVHEIYPLVALLDGTKKVVFIPNYCEFTVEKHHFVACHYPIVSHNGLMHGSTLLCGHSHGNCEVTSKFKGRGRRLDVGIESFGGPISLKFVLDFVKDRDYDAVDHHG